MLTPRLLREFAGRQLLAARFLSKQCLAAVQPPADARKAWFRASVMTSRTPGVCTYPPPPQGFLWTATADLVRADLRAREMLHDDIEAQLTSVSPWWRQETFDHQLFQVADRGMFAKCLGKRFMEFTKS